MACKRSWAGGRIQKHGPRLWPHGGQGCKAGPCRATNSAYVAQLRYAQESSWREDNRRVSNGNQVNRVAALAMKRGKSVDFTGYWQRHIAD
jgi:hypothetical protein